MDCKQCSDVIKPEDTIKCTTCQGLFHYVCSGLKESDFKKMLPMNKARWKCHICKLSKKTNSNISPKLVGPESMQSQCTPSSEIKSLIAHFDDRFNSLHTTMDSFKSFITEELRKLLETVSFWSTKITSIESSISSVVDRVNEMDKEVLKIQHIESELEEMRLKMNELSDSNRRNEQWVRRSNIQINGIPHKNGENLMQIVKNLSTKSGFVLNTESDIDFVTRIAVKNDTNDNKPRPIILKMQSRYKKDDFLSAIRKLKNLRACDIGFPGIKSNIYVNESLIRL